MMSFLLFIYVFVSSVALINVAVAPGVSTLSLSLSLSASTIPFIPTKSRYMYAETYTPVLTRLDIFINRVLGSGLELRTKGVFAHLEESSCRMWCLTLDNNIERLHFRGTYVPT